MSNLITILVADDHPLVREGLSTRLARALDLAVIGLAAAYLGLRALSPHHARARSDRPSTIRRHYQGGA